MLSMTVPIYQCEIAPGHGRGLFVSIEYFCLNSGYALSSWVGYGFFYAMPSEISWRGPYIIQAVLALVLVIWTFFLPETPRWLIKNGFKHEGLNTLADLHAEGDLHDPVVRETYTSIDAAITLEEVQGQASWGQLFSQYTRRATIGITCQLFAQFNGINAVLYYLPENLTRAGFSVSRSLLYSGICALVYCAGTIPTMFLVDKWGRKVFLLVGSAGLAGALALIGGLQFHADSLAEGVGRISTSDGIFTGMLTLFFRRPFVYEIVKVYAFTSSSSVQRKLLSIPLRFTCVEHSTIDGDQFHGSSEQKYSLSVRAPKEWRSPPPQTGFQILSSLSSHHPSSLPQAVATTFFSLDSVSYLSSSSSSSTEKLQGKLWNNSGKSLVNPTAAS